MFSGMLRWNLRLRLAVLLTFSVAIGLGLVFAFVLVVLRQQALDRRFAELERSVARIGREWSGPSSLIEEHEDFPEFDFTVSKPEGSVLASTTKTPQVFQAGRAKKDHRLFVGSFNGQLNVMGTVSWTETEAGLKQLGFVLMGLWLPLVALTAAVAWYGGGMVLHPVKELVGSADRLSIRSERGLLETTDRAEFAALAESLNKMVTRVRRSAQVQEQFAADAAHELRSPLALLRTRIETTLLNERSSEKYQEDLRSMLPKVDRLTSIVETLLSSARSSKIEVEPINLDQAVSEIILQWVLDEGWNQTRLKVKTAPCRSRITFEELQMVLGNFLDNAAHHSPDQANILVTLMAQEGVAKLTILDAGPGLSPDAKFERFYRSDEARSREGGGAGIGLAVVKRIVESRQGQVGFSEVESGAEAFMILPIVSNC
jgi:signal transduction histidine kinase